MAEKTDSVSIRVSYKNLRQAEVELIKEFRLQPLATEAETKGRSRGNCDGIAISDLRSLSPTLFDSVETMVLPFLNPYLDSVGGPSFSRGCNFATGGCTILAANVAPISPFSFGIQVAQFLRFKARVLELLAKGKKFDKFLPREDYFKQGIYMFDIGENDLDEAFYSSSEGQVLALIPIILSEFEAGIKRLYDQGAKNFWIHNMGPLRCLPRIIAVFGTDPSKLDEHGCVNSHNQAAKLFNLQLQTLSKKFQGQFTDANISYVDIFSIKYDLISNFSEYGNY